MPAQSSLNDDDISKLRSAVPKPGNNILYATLARIYFAYPQPNRWSYGGLQGALAFVKDVATNLFSFRLVDLDGTRGVIWRHELYEGFEYFSDRPFFQSFPGDECMIGFVFCDEKEAKAFHKKVTSKKEKSKATEKKKKVSKSGKIDKSMISGPTAGSFVHIAHMGYDSEKGFTSTGVDPSWTAFLGQLEDQGINKEIIENDMDFIREFVRDAQRSPQPVKKKPPPPPTPRRTAHAQQSSISSLHAAPPLPPSRAPPPPSRPIPPPTPSRPVQPAPPSRRPPPARSVKPPSPTRPSQPSHAPPPPPARPGMTAPPAPPPPPPARPSVPTPPPPTRSIPTAPPAPPAPPAAPPAPPPPPSFGAPPPPAPPAPPGAPPPPAPPAPGLPSSSLPTPQPGRNELLASIAGKGIHSLRKTEPESKSVEERPTTSSSGGIGGGNDLTAALAAALLERNKKLGDSDDDEEEEDDWD